MSKNRPDFDPNGIGLRNGHFIGLPFTEEEANIVIISVPWDVTVSYGAGTAMGASNILEASTQLDLYDPQIKDAWKFGIYLRPLDTMWLERRNELRPKVERYIAFLEEGGQVERSAPMKAILDEVNKASEALNKWVEAESIELLKRGKIPVILGGDHSVPLGLMRALSSQYEDFGVLHIDAHLDLRKAYEGFTYSHASIFRNALELSQITKLVQIGVRDFCEEEALLAEADNRIVTFFDADLKDDKFNGLTWKEQVRIIVTHLPHNVYVSFDIDGLRPDLCPNTGTPVPGGLEFDEALYLFTEILIQGKQLIGFDLCEVAGEGEWDANVGARLLYKMCNFLGTSSLDL